MLLRMLRDLFTPSSPASSRDEVPFTASAGAQEEREPSGNGEKEPHQIGPSSQVDSSGGGKEFQVEARTEVASVRITVVNDCAGYNEPFVELCLRSLSGLHLVREPSVSASRRHGVDGGQLETCSVVAARIQVRCCMCASSEHHIHVHHAFFVYFLWPA